MTFGSLGGGDSVEVTVTAAVVAVIILFTGVSAVWRYRPHAGLNLQCETCLSIYKYEIVKV